MKTLNWCICTILILLTFISVIVGVVWLCKINDVQLTKDDIVDILGISISCTSLLITAFFVVMAVSAYSHIKEIEEVRKSADELEKRIKYADNISQDIFDIMLSYTEDIIKQADINKEKGKKLKFLTLLYRFGAYKYPQYNDLDTRQSYLLNLASFGDVSDIIPLERICSDPNEDPQIKKTAKHALEEIKRRILKKEEGQKSFPWLIKLYNKIFGAR